MRISDWSSDVCSSDLAGIPGERYVIDFPLSAFGQLDHFADVGKMIRHRDTSLGAGSFRLVDDLLEAAPGGLAPPFLPFARQQVLGAFLGVDRVFQALFQAGYDLLLPSRVSAFHREF